MGGRWGGTGARERGVEGGRMLSAPMGAMEGGWTRGSGARNHGWNGCGDEMVGGRGEMGVGRRVTTGAGKGQAGGWGGDMVPHRVGSRGGAHDM